MTNSTTMADDSAFLAAALDPMTPSAQLAAIAQHIFLTADPDYERPTSGADFLRDIGRQGPLTALMDRRPPSALTAALVANPNTPQEHLLHFAADFPEAFLTNPVLLLLLLEHPDLFQQMDSLRLLVFLSHAAIPEELLGTMRHSASEWVGDAIRWHVNSPGDVGDDWDATARQALEGIPLPSIDGQQALIEHLELGTIPEWLLDRLRCAPEEYIQTVLHAPAEILNAEQPPIVAFEPNTQSFDPETIVDAAQAERKAAAESSDPAVLEALADDEDPAIRVRIAQNPATPAHLLEALVRDYSWSGQRIRLAVMRHPQVPEPVLERLASDESILIRNELARLPHMPQRLRLRLRDRALTSALYATDPFFHCIAMANPHTNPQHLAKGWRSPYWWGRYLLALNPAVPVETLAMLAQEGNRLVRAAARWQQRQIAKDIA